MLKSKKILFLSLVTSSFIFANETTLIEEITVSANKMEENIKDVPQSITVIDEETIEQKGIKTVADVIKEIPNMDIEDSHSGPMVSFRGIVTSVFSNTNPIVIYIDGVPYYDKFDFNPSLANVEQIEVLRGPQGTLYGKDAIGAVINIVTKTPTNKWKGSIGVEYGNHNYMETSLNTSGAIIDDKLFAGINGSFEHDDGWIKNHYEGMKKDANEKNDRKTSGFLLYKPTDELSTKLTVADSYEKNYSMDGFYQDKTIPISELKRDKYKDLSFDVPTFDKTKVKSQALNIAYEIEKAKFDSTTTHKKFDLDSEFDKDTLSNQLYYDGLKNFNYSTADTWTQEFKLSSKNQDIKWITGIYFDKEDREQNPHGMEFPNFDNNYNYLGNWGMNAVSDTTSKTQAIFGQVIVPLGNSFDLTLGGRYQKITKEMDLDMYMYPVGGNQFLTNQFNEKKDWNTFLPKMALSYKINDNLTTYASVSTGYMPGGFNLFASSGSASDNTFEPQKSLNYEIGAKYIGNSFALNANIFRMDIEDIHVYKQVTSGVFETDNGEKAHSQGIEFDGTYFITNNWSISGAVGLIQAKYDDFDNGVKKFDGENIDNTPKYTANLGISYFADNGIYGRVDFNARGNTYYFDGKSDMIKTDGAIITNAKIGYKIGDFDIYSFVKNITDEDYIKSYNPWITFNEPRKFGIGAIYKF